jgi:ABC-2 type transport system ATP-binding protein
MPASIVSILSLSRAFGRRVALDAIDLEIREGEIVGLAGPNGSGKTTLLRLAAGLLRPTGGAIRVLGLDPWPHRAAVMKEARFAFAPPALFDALSPREHLFHLTRSGSRPRPDRRAIDPLLDRVGLLERADDPVRTFSLGMRQRLSIAQALLPEPRLLVLDEPSEGLDPLGIVELQRILVGLSKERGTTILLSSHLTASIEEIADRMLLLYEGRELFQGSPAELCAGTSRLSLLTSAPDLALGALVAKGLPARLDGNGTLLLPPESVDLEGAARLLAESGVKLLAFHERRETLEQALLTRLRRQQGSEETP